MPNSWYKETVEQILATNIFTFKTYITDRNYTFYTTQGRIRFTVLFGEKSYWEILHVGVYRRITLEQLFDLNVFSDKTKEKILFNLDIFNV